MKRLIFLFLFGFFIVPFGFVFAQEKVQINFFFSPTCPHCAKEWKFLDGLEGKYPNIKINRYSVAEKENIELLKSFYENYHVPPEYRGMVPATFTNTKYFIGYNKEVAKNIEENIIICTRNAASKRNTSFIDLEGNISLPLIGKFNVKNYSLPVLTIILGILDGFNVCSLGALVLILGIVLAFRSRMKILVLGGIFILTTALVYGFLIVLWYQVFSFLIPYMRLMELLIGILGVVGGVYFLREFIKFKKHGPACNVKGGKGLTAKFSLKFQKILKGSASIFLLGGAVLLFAGIITIVEFPCSAAVPVIFAGVLSQAHPSGIYYLLYIAFYLIFYMLDEIIVFLVALFTMKLWLASSRFITWVVLLEAAVLFSLGFYYLLGFSVIL